MGDIEILSARQSATPLTEMTEDIADIDALYGATLDCFHAARLDDLIDLAARAA